MRNRHLFKGQFKKPIQEDSIEAVLKFRKECEQGAARFGKLPAGIKVEKDLMEGMHSEWLIPEAAAKDRLIFYVHGGGYISGSCNDHRVLLAKIARQAGTTILHFEYRLAPEHPFPAALNDSVNAYKATLIKGYKAENIVMMGESAGGGLCLATLLALRDQNIQLPKAAVAISPWTDLSCSGESYNTKNKVSLAPLNSWNVFSRFYTGNNDLRNPYISPLFGHLNGLPPLFINAGNSDELFDDALAFYEKAKQQNVDISFREGHKMVHCYPLLSPLFPEATEAMNEIIVFIQKHLNHQCS